MGKTDISKQERHRALVLDEFRRLVQDILEPHHDDQFLLRWLMARDFDLIKAEKMIRESFIFRKKIGANTILTDYTLPEVYQKHMNTALLGFDKNNCAVRVIMIGLMDYKGFQNSLSMVEIMKIFMYYFEKDAKKMQELKDETGISGMKTTFVLDYTEFSFRKFYHKDIIKKTIQLLNMYQDNYPETLKMGYLVNVPSYFTFLFNIFKPFLSSVTMNKVKVFGTEGWQEELRSLLSPQEIPAFMGGELTDSDGNPKCTHLINWDWKIDPCYYTTDAAHNTEDPSMKTTTVQQRAVLQVPVEVETPGSVLKWIFATKECNIRFGLFRRRGGKTSRMEEVIPVGNVDCHIMREENEYICEKTGTYVLCFDNSYSWLTSKQISYKVELQMLNLDDGVN